MRRAVLPVLAKLLTDESVSEHVPHVLAELLKENKELQAAAADADAVSKLAALLQQDTCPPRLKVARLAIFKKTANETVWRLGFHLKHLHQLQKVCCACVWCAASANGPLAHASCAVQEGTLRALSTLCADRESSRRQLVEAKAIGPIVRSLYDPHEEVGFSPVI